MQPRVSVWLLRHGCLFALLLASVVTAHADVLPGPVMPDQVAKSLTPKPSLVPKGVVPPRSRVQSQQTHVTLSAEEQKITFKLNGITLIGNHVFSTKELEILYRSKLHHTISIADLYKIVDSITNYYRNNGYILSFAFIPPQKANNGVVNIEITEGYINQIHVIGEPGGAKCLVEGMGYRIRKCPPLNIKQLERYMLLANEIPNTTVKAVLSPSKTGIGAADLNLETYTKPLSAYFSYDNYGTRYIGPQQMTANATSYSMINSGDSTSFTFTKTPKGGELIFADLNYNGPVGDSGARWILGDTRVQTHPLFVLQPTQTDGFSNNIYINYLYPVIRTRSRALNLTAGFNYLDSNSTTFDDLLYMDHLRNLDLGMSYNFADTYYGANMIALNLRKGLPFFGYSSDTNQFTATTSRPGGYAAYTKVTAQLSRLQAIKGPVSLLAIAKGQWAFVPLLSSEQFTFGGNPVGRGYDPAELIGDRGVSASLELRVDNNFNYAINTLQLYTFYDVGGVWNILVNASSPTKVSASSIGLGLRFTMTKYISGNLMWAQPLTKQVAAEELISEGWRPRTFFSIVASFN